MHKDFGRTACKRRTEIEKTKGEGGSERDVRAHACHEPGLRGLKIELAYQKGNFNKEKRKKRGGEKKKKKGVERHVAGLKKSKQQTEREALRWDASGKGHWGGDGKERPKG